MSLYKSCDFSEGVIEVAKIEFSLEGVYGGYFWLSLEENFLRAFFPVFFSSAKDKKHPEKKPRRNSVNENSRKVRRNTNL